MDKSYEEIYHEIETEQWWFVARRNTVLKLLEGVDKAAKILDVGCSSGALLSDLKRAGYLNAQGVDMSHEAIGICHANGNMADVMDAAQTTFEDNTFDIIVSSDILEHIEQDDKALVEWKRILKPSGRMHLFVPAYMSLWSEHDVINHHFRRYSKRELRDKVNQAGWNIQTQSFWNCLLFTPVAVIRFVLNAKKKADAPSKNHQIGMPNRMVNSGLKTLLAMEDVFFKFIGLPIGISLYIEATKKV